MASNFETADRVATTAEESFIDCARYAEGDDLTFLKETVASNKAMLDVRDELGRTAAHMAAANGNVEALRILIDAGAAPLANLEGNTALHYAAANNHLGCAKVMLVSRKWTVGTRNVWGRTALQEIGEKQFDDMEALLLEHDDELDRYTCPPTVVMDVPDSMDDDSGASVAVSAPSAVSSAPLASTASAPQASSAERRITDEEYKTQVVGSAAVDEIE
jgi:ankyrin repeat protein